MPFCPMARHAFDYNFNIIAIQLQDRKEMYILASDFSKKTLNTYLKLEIRIVCKEF